MKKQLYNFLLTFICLGSYAFVPKNDIDTISFSDVKHTMLLGSSMQVLEDKSNQLSLQDVLTSHEFLSRPQSVPDLGVSNSSFWIKFLVKNYTGQETLLLELANPIIDEVELYTLSNDGTYSVQKMGEYQPFSMRSYDHPSYVFNLEIPKDSAKTFFMKIRSREQISLPLKLGTQNVVLDSLREKDLFFGLYVGIMLAMFFYNLFIYITTRDRSYLYYIVYIMFVGLTQTCFQGYTFQFLWNNSPWMAQHSVVILSALVGISAAEFARLFLSVDLYLRSAKKILYAFYLSYLICIVLAVLGKNSIQLLDITALSISIYLLVVAIIIVRKGSRPATYFLFAWIIFLIGVIVFALKNIGILPYNNLTLYTMPAGSAIEAILLSFALADRINVLKKQKEESQAITLQALKENEKLITEQKIVLEQKVEERTTELKHTNVELESTLTDLKNAQTQLVSVEKMASLGQLTAGIAHEINNPINFVSANVKPLKLDIDDILELINKYEEIAYNGSSALKLKEIEDYKKQIDFDYVKKEMSELLMGIEDGAKRTAEIVSGLKNFSRLDESDLKLANINEGIESTLVLLKSAIPEDVKVVLELGNIQSIECLPGKLNQVFMNLFNNAIYALGKTENRRKQLLVKTYEQNDHIYVSIEDTGIGMTPEVQAKVFDPFFTTKDVGEGTGLGMSIVFKIIESHHAKIEIESDYGVGTKVLLILNKKLDIKEG